MTWLKKSTIILGIPKDSSWYLSSIFFRLDYINGHEHLHSVYSFIVNHCCNDEAEAYSCAVGVALHGTSVYCFYCKFKITFFIFCLLRMTME